MNAHWFILKKNEHLGPYSKEEIYRLFNASKISENVQIWKEGWKEAKTYHEAFVKSAFLSEKSELPPLPKEILEDKKEDIPLVAAPKLKKMVDTKSGYNVPRRKVKVTKAQKSILPFDVKFRFKFGKSDVLLSLVALIFLGALFYIHHLANSPNVFDRPSHMSYAAYKRLKKAALTTTALMARASLSDDKKTLWIGINSPVNGDVYLSFKSLYGKTLGGEAEFEAKGEIKNRLIEIDKIKFKKGSRVIDGLYKVSIKTADNISLPWYGRFVGKKPVAFDFDANLIVSSLSPNVFKKQLAKVRAKARKNSQVFWDELIQKYQTVMMITKQIREGFTKIFSAKQSEWKKQTAIFESDYQRKYGIFFTEFVKANEASYEIISKKNFQDSTAVLAGYGHLSNLAKQIGSQSMYILEKLSEVEEKGGSVDALKEDALFRINSIISKCERKINSLTKPL